MVTPGRIIAERPTQTLAPRRTGATRVGRDGSKAWWSEFENRHQVPDQAIVTDYDAVIRYDRGTSVDEDPLAEHKGAVRRLRPLRLVSSYSAGTGART